MDWQNLFYRGFNIVESLIVFYVGTINSIYFMLILLGYFVLRQYHTRLNREQIEALIRSPMLPAVSILAPAYNEAVTIRDSVRAMLKLHYPNHEVIVINDGSKDDTLDIMIEEFRLYKSSRRPSTALSTKAVKAIYESRDPIPLIVIDKENGGKADSINAGLNVSRSPLVAVVDSDSLLEPDSLLHVARPFLEDFDRTIAAGGIIRVVNGCDVAHGQVTRITVPSSMIARFQVIEYLRAFLGGRVAFSFINSLLIVSGAFGLFRRDAVIEAGGFMPSTVGEDMELIVRLHRLWREKGVDYRIVFVPEPVCWTEVPETLKVLQRQRNRWQRGTVESIWMHKRMLFNPKYGVVGMFGLPYFTLFEMLGPAVEISGYFFTIAGLAFGIISTEIAILFFAVSVLYGILLSISSILLEEATTRRYPSPFDVLQLFFASIVENFGFRQLLTIWRMKGLIDGIRGKQGWGNMERKGFQAAQKTPSSEV